MKRIKKVSQTVPTTAQVVDGYSNSATDSYSCNYVNELNTYSTTEHIVGKWIDGRPLYEKTYEIQVPTPSSDYTQAQNYVYSNITGLDITVFFMKTGFFTILNEGTRPIPMLLDGGSGKRFGVILSFGGLNASEHVIQIRNSNVGYGGGTAYITVNYCKTTD